MYRIREIRTLASLLFLAITLLCLVYLLESKARAEKLQTDVNLTPPAAPQSRAERLTAGVLAIKGSRPHLRSILGRLVARRIVEDALAATRLPKYAWLPTRTLLAIGANESDLIPWCRGGPGRYDCGIAQNRATVFRKSRKDRETFCQAVRANPALSFRYAALELTRYKDRYCRYKKGWRKWRCILNTYNQGPNYVTEETCTTGRCKVKSRYYLRVLCYERGIKLGRAPRWNCRKAQSKRWIDRAYR
jgi:hypothetical protein